MIGLIFYTNLILNIQRRQIKQYSFIMDNQELRIAKANKIDLIFNVSHPLHDYFGLIENYYQSGNVYLGSMHAVNAQCIYQKQIGAILTVMDKKSYEKQKILELVASLELQKNHLFIDVKDSKHDKIEPFFKDTIAFFERCIDNKVNVFVHCKGGMSRSASILCCYMMKKYDLSFDQANKILKQRRNIVCINQGFEKELRNYEKYLKVNK